MPLDDCDDDGGPLKSIAAYALTEAAPAAPAPVHAPTPHPAAPAPAPQQAPAQPSASTHRHANLRTPGSRISPSKNTAATQAATQHRQSPYTPEALKNAWAAAQNAFPGHQILTHAMRASAPVQTEGHTYTVTVQHQTQVDELVAALPRIHQILRDALANDDVTIKIAINQGEASPDTWNERRVLEDMADHYPALRQFVEKLHLTLN